VLGNERVIGCRSCNVFRLVFIWQCKTHERSGVWTIAAQTTAGGPIMHGHGFHGMVHLHGVPVLQLATKATQMRL
jgi:hypothetical protein